MSDATSQLSEDLPTELFFYARAWLNGARELEPRRRAEAIERFRRAAGVAATFLRLAPDDPRAGRVRALLVESLDRASLTGAADAEAATLGEPRPATEPAPVRELRMDSILNLGWAHLRIAQGLDAPRAPIAQRARAVARFARAADYYRLYVDDFPDSPAAPGARSELANALLGADRPSEAAAVLEEMARAVPSRRAEGLRRAVHAHGLALERALAEGVVGDPPAASMPAPVRALYDARVAYLADPDHEPELARSFRLENALLDRRYGRRPEAEQTLLTLLAEECTDEVAMRAARTLGASEPCRAAP